MPDLVGQSDIDLVELGGWAYDPMQNAARAPWQMRARHRGMKESEIDPKLRAAGVTKGNERASAEEFLDEIAKVLMEKETIEKEEFEKLMKG